MQKKKIKKENTPFFKKKNNKYNNHFEQKWSAHATLQSSMDQHTQQHLQRHWNLYPASMDHLTQHDDTMTYFMGCMHDPEKVWWLGGNPFSSSSSFSSSSVSSVVIENNPSPQVIRSPSLQQPQPQPVASKSEETSKKIEQLPVQTWKIPSTNNTHKESAQDNKKDLPSCAICLEVFKEKDQVKRLPCLHEFHAHEIDTWLLTKPSCPICRFKI